MKERKLVVVDLEKNSFGGLPRIVKAELKALAATNIEKGVERLIDSLFSSDKYYDELELIIKEKANAEQYDLYYLDERQLILDNEALRNKLDKIKSLAKYINGLLQGVNLTGGAECVGAFMSNIKQLAAEVEND